MERGVFSDWETDECERPFSYALPEKYRRFFCKSPRRTLAVPFAAI